MFRVELLKLKRSNIWVVTVILPIVVILTGGINFWMNQGVLDSGWSSLFGQVLLFYSMIFFAMGVAILTAAAWRMEHQGTNWNLLRTHSPSVLLLMLAKTAAILLPVFVMQLVVVLGTIIFGTVVVGDLGPVPIIYLWSMLLTVVVAVPLIAMQSLLSALLKSFAAPVGICFAGCVIGFLATVAPEPLGYLMHVVPQSLVTRALSMESAAITTSESLTWGSVTPLLAAAVIISVVIFALSTKLVKLTDN